MSKIHSLRGLILVVSIAGFSATAAAQSASPAFMTLDRVDVTPRLGLQVGLIKLDDVSLDDGFIVRPEIYAQSLLPGMQLGVYGHIPFAWLVNFNGDDTSAHGNLETGVFYWLGGAGQLILRGGLSLGISSDDPGDRLLLGLSSYERVTDIVGILANTTALRLSMSTLQQRDNLFFRGDFGFDLMLDNDSTEDILMRLNLAAGVRLSGVDLAAELVNIGVLDSEDELADRFFHTLSFGFRTQGINQFHLGMVFPLDRALRGEIWILSLGLHHVL